MLFPAQKTTLALAMAAQYSSSPFLIVGQLLLRITSLASPDLRALRVDLYPKTNLPLFMTNESLLLMFSLVVFFTIFCSLVFINYQKYQFYLHLFVFQYFMQFEIDKNVFKMCQNEIRNYNNKMTNSQSSEWEKNQRKQKNFQCPCGKSYLSYPALYTHIKQAHNGKAPGQIKRPDTQTRGRPKATGNTKIQQHNKFIQQDLKKDPLPELLKMIEGANVSTTRQVQQIYLNQPVFKLIMNDKDKPFNPKFLKQDRIYDVKMGQGIIQFFRDIDQLIENKNVYDQIVMLIVLLTEHIIEETEDQNVLSLGTIGLMPEFVNYFIIHDFKKPVQRLKLENLWIFQNQNTIRVFNVFFKWMLYKKFTLTKVQINTKYLNPDQSGQQGNEQNNQDLNGEENNNESSESEQSIDEQQNKENRDQQNQLLNHKQHDHEDQEQNEKSNDKPLQNPSDIS